MKRRTASYIRNFVFGVEDSLVSTIGLISGIAVAGVSVSTILLTGVVLVFVEAFSMGVGSLLSENSVDEYVAKREISYAKSFSGALVMFASYILSGFLIILPYVVFDPKIALAVSILLAVLSLFVLGYASARWAGVNPWWRGLQMSSIGGAAILIGSIAGNLANQYLLL